MAKPRRAKHVHAADAFYSPRQLDDQTQERQALLDEAREGSGKAHGELLERHRKRMVGYFAARLSNRLRRKSDEQDLAQTASFKAWRKFNQFAGHTVTSYWAWLRQICYSVVQRLLRTFHQAKRDLTREELLDELQLDDGTQHPFGRRQLSPDEIAEALETAGQLQAAINALPDEDDRQIAALRFTEWLTCAEIAERLGFSIDSVKRSLKRIAAALRRQFAES